MASTNLSIQTIADFGVFTVIGDGWGPAAALNGYGTVNGEKNPARVGTTISIFGTGEFAAACKFGLRAGSLYGGIPVEIERAGPATGALPGVQQINFTVPDFSRTWGDDRYYIWLDGAVSPAAGAIYMAR